MTLLPDQVLAPGCSCLGTNQAGLVGGGCRDTACLQEECRSVLEWCKVCCFWHAVCQFTALLCNANHVQCVCVLFLCVLCI